MTEQALFYGVVHPMAAGWRFDETFKVKFLDSGSNAEIFLADSKFIVVAFGETPFDQSFANELVAVIQGLMDALGFHIGSSTRVELFGGFTSPSTLIVVNPSAWPEAVGKTSEDPKVVSGDVLSPYTYASMNEPLVRFALADICKAFVEPTDSGFLAYRAIESIRQWYQDVDPATEDAGEGWSRLRTSLGVNKDELMRLALIARRRRHGRGDHITEEERLWSIDLARRVVAAFVATLPPPSNDSIF